MRRAVAQLGAAATIATRWGEGSTGSRTVAPRPLLAEGATVNVVEAATSGPHRPTVAQAEAALAAEWQHHMYKQQRGAAL